MVSEFPAVLFGPAFDYYFLVGIKLDGVAALAVEIAEEAVLPSTEGEVGHGSRDSDVDADISRGRFIAEAARGRSARCKQRRLITVGAAFEKGEGFIHVVGVNQAQDRTEDFGIGKIAGRGNVVEDGGIYEIAGLVFRDFRIASVEQNFCALLFSDADERFDALFTLRSDHRAHLHAFFKAVANSEFGSGVGDGIAESFLRFTDRHSN